MICRSRTTRGSAPAVLAAVALIICGVRSCQSPRSAHAILPKQALAAPNQLPTFVGAVICGSCHPEEKKRWTGSHHQLAMQPATDATVLGDFNNSSFSHDGIISTFSRTAGKFMVRTDGPDGRLHDYEVKFTFGVYPLQQYLIPMPGGRLQALGIAWDCRPRREGGQRWFFLYPGQKVTVRDPLHWSGIDQNWNYMCADCHSTNARKNYDARSRSFSTSWSEVDVACEACHGPGSNHVAWAKKSGDWRRFDDAKGLTIALDERKGASWASNNRSGKVRRSRPRLSEREIQMCARCHSRRGQIHEDYVNGQAAGDDYRITLLEPDAYFPDGQINGEDYEYGSFVQSRMFATGVTCSDCHEPHSLKPRAAENGICTQCHMASKYDSPKHHFHKTGSQAARCVACHMPTRTYMIVHARHDHSLRVPRPDLSEALGTPNPCSHCHADKPAKWASDSIRKWYGHVPQGFQSYGAVFRSALIGEPRAEPSLRRLALDREQPAIARATALSMLSVYAIDHETVGAAVTDPSDLVRRAAAASLANSDLAASAPILVPLLSDPVRAVRLEAAEVLAGVKTKRLLSATAAALERATNEYVAAQNLNADRPEAHLNLGVLWQKTGRPRDSEAEFKTALSLDPSFAPAAVNLADLYREENRDGEGERVLRNAINRADDASLEHALGLLLVRQKRLKDALAPLGAAVGMAPGNASYAYVYALALYEAGQTAAAIDTFKLSLKEHPYDRDSLEALVGMLRDRGSDPEASSFAQRLEQVERAVP